MESIKIVVIGDSAVGKSAMIIRYCTNRYDSPVYIPTMSDVFNVKYNKHVNLSISDTAGLSDYDRLRPISYPGTDVVIICFSIDSKASYENVIHKWKEEIDHFLPQVPIILVGTKCDLKDINGLNTDDGERLAKKINAVKYCECSCLLNEGIKEVFDNALEAKLEPLEEKRDKTCKIM